MPRRFKSRPVNPLSDISELQVHVDLEGLEASRIVVSSDVRIAPVTENVSGRDFKYGPKRAFLSFQVSGCEAPRGARHNDAPPEPLELSEVHRETRTSEMEGNAQAQSGLSVALGAQSGGVSAKIGSEFKASSASSYERTLSAKRLSKFVKSRPNLKWELEARNPADPSSLLDDTYLADHHMFSADIAKGANQVAVEGTLYCRKADFSISAIDKRLGDKFFQPRNREAIMSLVLQKAIKESVNGAGLLGEKYIVLSKCNVVDEE